MNFFGGLFKGVIITILGTLVVYIIFFIIMAPKLPKNIAGMKSFVSEMVNVKDNVRNMQNKSSAFLEKKDTRMALEGDNFTPEEYQKALAEAEAEAAAASAVPTQGPGSQAIITVVESDTQKITRLQQEVDQLEKQNRRLILRLQKFEGNPTESKE